MSKIVIAIGAVVALGGIAYAGTEIYINREAEREVASFAESVSDQADFRYRRVRTSLWNRNARIEGIEISFRDPEQTVVIDQVEVNEWDFQNDPPTFGTVTLAGLRLDATNADPDIQTLLTGLEYDELSSDLSLSYAVRDGQGPVKDHHELDFGMQWRTASAFDFALDLQLLDVDFAAIEAMDPAAAASISVGRVSAVYTDESLIPRALSYIAAEEGREVDDLKAEAQTALAALADDYPAYAEAINALQSFIDNPGSLSIEVSPPEPITPFSLILVDPNEWPSRLNLQVSAR